MKLRLPTWRDAAAVAIVFAASTAMSAGDPLANPCPAGHDPYWPIELDGTTICLHIDATADPSVVGSEGDVFAHNEPPEPLPPICHGDGVSGPRVELLFVHSDAEPSRLDQFFDEFTGPIAGRMERAVRDRSAALGEELGIRFHMPDCELSVEVVPLPDEELNPEDNDVVSQHINVMKGVFLAGYNRPDRKYLVFVDMPTANFRHPSGNGNCGSAAYLLPSQYLGLDEAEAAQQLFDDPGPTNANNGFIPQYATAFRSWSHTAPELNYCWGAGTTGANIEIHELWHTMGAVQPSAPNSNGLTHCVDEVDIMCYSEHTRPPVHYVCFTVLEPLDCNADDYFNPRPEPDSYLATHWNTAESRFLSITNDVVPHLPYVDPPAPRPR